MGVLLLHILKEKMWLLKRNDYNRSYNKLKREKKSKKNARRKLRKTSDRERGKRRRTIYNLTVVILKNYQACSRYYTYKGIKAACVCSVTASDVTRFP